MKKIILILLLITSSLTFAQGGESKWDVGSNHELSLNYNLLGRNYAQGAFYGAAGYGAGMWLSGNKAEWGIVGALVAVNLPIILEKRLDETETVLGRNLGAATVSFGLTVYIETTRKGRLRYTIPMLMRRN